MTELEHSNAQDERSQEDSLSDLSMADLRKYAKLTGITSQRDWTKEDYVDAIKRKLAPSNGAVQLVVDPGLGLKPGHARVLIHRDPTPGHSNRAVHVGLNGRFYAIPRGLEVEIPRPFLSCLSDAVTTYTEQDQAPSRDNPGGTFRENSRLSYPFQVIAVDPREYVMEDARSRHYADRKAFFDQYESWPTEGELKEWKKARINRDMRSDK